MDSIETLEYQNNIVKVRLIGEMSLSEIKRIIQRRRELANHQKVYTLTDITSMTKVSKEAKKYLASDEAASDINAGAIIINSYASMMIGNLYLFFEKPKVPVRLFNTEEKALTWLHSFNPDEHTNESNTKHNKNIINEINVN